MPLKFAYLEDLDGGNDMKLLVFGTPDYLK
jgi:hypothetical protein